MVSPARLRKGDIFVCFWILVAKPRILKRDKVIATFHVQPCFRCFEGFPVRLNSVRQVF